jgi:hypothetical protein
MIASKIREESVMLILVRRDVQLPIAQNASLENSLHLTKAPMVFLLPYYLYVGISKIPTYLCG